MAGYSTVIHLVLNYSVIGYYFKLSGCFWLFSLLSVVNGHSKKTSRPVGVDYSLRGRANNRIGPKDLFYSITINKKIGGLTLATAKGKPKEATSAYRLEKLAV